MPEPTQTPPVSIFGSQMSRVNNSSGLAQALEAGVHWVRRGTLHWDELEPERTEPPAYRWSKVDEASFVTATENGLEVVAVVNRAPDWALQVPGVRCGPIKPQSLEAFAQFLNAVVDRYSRPPYNVRYWEIGNEPDIDPSIIGGHSGYGCWGNVNGEYYGGGYFAEMLKVVYPAIKAAEPGAQVILGGLLLDCDPRHPEGCTDEGHGAKPLQVSKNSVHFNVAFTVSKSGVPYRNID